MIAKTDEQRTVSPELDSSSSTRGMEELEKRFATELRKWWSFDDGQVHTHSWHSREDFIEKKLPKLLADALSQLRARVAELEAALRPFALVEWTKDRWPTELKVSLSVQGTSVDGEYALAGDFRNARETLAAIRPTPEQSEGG